MLASHATKTTIDHGRSVFFYSAPLSSGLIEWYAACWDSSCPMCVMWRSDGWVGACTIFVSHFFIATLSIFALSPGWDAWLGHRRVDTYMLAASSNTPCTGITVYRHSSSELLVVMVPSAFEVQGIGSRLQQMAAT
jgi:hypothetical protein